jgi:hypothetical protein
LCGGRRQSRYLLWLSLLLLSLLLLLWLWLVGILLEEHRGCHLLLCLEIVVVQRIDLLLLLIDHVLLLLDVRGIELGYIGLILTLILTLSVAVCLSHIYYINIRNFT